MTILGIIPARGGSKGIKDKNIQMLGDLPLIGHTMRAASESKLDQVIISTESNDVLAAVTNCMIHGVGKRCEIPFTRPAELAADDTSMIFVVVHALKNIDFKPDAVMILQPTCPFRTAKQINEAIDVFQKLNVDSLVSVVPVPVKYNPEWVFNEDREGLLWLASGMPARNRLTRRQDFRPAYTPNGYIYLVRTALACSGTLYGDKVFPYIMKENINIDSLEDLAEARKIYEDTHSF